MQVDMRRTVLGKVSAIGGRKEDIRATETADGIVKKNSMTPGFGKVQAYDSMSGHSGC